MNHRTLLAAVAGALLLAVLVVVAWLEIRYPGLLRGSAIWVREQYRVEELRGRVVDATTGAGIPGATVVVRSNSSWMNPTLVGDASHGYATTDADGRFAVRYQEVGSTRVSARAPGYATVMRMRYRGREMVLPSSPVPPGETVTFHTFRVDLPLAAPTAYVDLARGAVVADGDSADLAFTLEPDSTRQVFVAALGRGGLLEEPPPPQPLLADPLALRCAAPDSGYAAADTIAERVSMATWFVRGRGGDAYARVRILVQRTPGERGLGATVTLECWRNTAGGRNVCLVPAEGERVEFREMDLPRR